MAAKKLDLMQGTVDVNGAPDAFRHDECCSRFC